jgi:hypothetical protein
VFAGLGEEGGNDLIAAFFTARPHYLTYGSWPLVAATTVNETQVAPISVPPLLPAPVAFKVSFSIPVLDLYPPDASMPELTLHAHQFSVRSTVQFTMLCGVGRPGNGRQREGKPGQAINCKFDLYATGRLVNRFTAQGQAIGFEVDEIDVQDVQPACLEDMLNCILVQVVNSILRDVTIPLPVLSAGAFALTLEQGPQIDADVVDAWGTV